MEKEWKETLNRIEERLNNSRAYDIWIKPVRFKEVDGNVLKLEVPNMTFERGFTPFIDMIKEEFFNIVGWQPDIQIVYNGQEEQKSATTFQPTSTTMFNQSYTFDNFVVGSGNRLAHAAALAVAQSPGIAYNPLFIYGGFGLGKTHLMQAIGQFVTSREELNIIYLPAEVYLNEFIQSIKNKTTQVFRQKFRKVDFLLIDDIHFIAGKEGTQEEFFHTFNTLKDSGKQIVVSSDKFPKDIPNLESRLRSRFEWGLIADIQPPEIETKIAIIEKKIQENNIELPNNVIHYIASHVESNIRELEGFLVRIGAYSSLTGREIDLDLVKEVLNNLVHQNTKGELSIEEIMKVISGKLNVKISDIKAHNKNKNAVFARQIAMYLARKLTNYSFPDIGQKIGGRDHSTVIYANNKILNGIKSDAKIKTLIQEIEDILTNK